MELAPGGSTDVGGVRITATPAVHEGRRWRYGTRADSIGFIASGSQAVYFAGDTDLFDEMAGMAGTIDARAAAGLGLGPDPRARAPGPRARGHRRRDDRAAGRDPDPLGHPRAARRVAEARRPGRARQEVRRARRRAARPRCRCGSLSLASAWRSRPRTPTAQPARGPAADERREGRPGERHGARRSRGAAAPAADSAHDHHLAAVGGDARAAGRVHEHGARDEHGRRARRGGADRADQRAAMAAGAQICAPAHGADARASGSSWSTARSCCW